MKIIVDAFGGDNAPLEILKGSVLAAEEFGCEILLVGDESKIKACAAENDINISGMEIRHTEDVIMVEENPKSILKEHKNSSMGLGLKLLADGEGDAFVTAGSTGAVVVGSTFLVKRIKGVKRAAIASLMPNDEGMFMMMDCGANLTCSPEVLNSFAIMGKTYMEKVMGVSNPRIALANIGVEENKGTETLVDAYQIMKKANYNFVGNIEVRDIAKGGADVVVAEGFTGNVILKMYEGVAGVLSSNIKAMFMKNAMTKVAALMMKDGLDEFKKKMDYKEFGGAPLMGIEKPVIKSHGSADARTFKNAIKQAIFYAERDVIGEITECISSKKDKKKKEKKETLDKSNDE